MRLPQFVALAFTFSIVASPVFSGDFQKGVDAYMKRDFETARNELHPLADKGFAPAQTQLAFMYWNGEGVPKSPLIAHMWFRRAAEQGDGKAQYFVGSMYALGIGEPKNLTLTYMWTKIAVTRGGYLDKGNTLERLEKHLSKADVEKANILANKCIQKKFKDC